MRAPFEIRQKRQTQGVHWTYDLTLVALSGIAITLVVKYLSFEDSRPLYNAWTYLVAIPTGLMLTGFLSQLFAGRAAERVFQSAFLISVSLHVLLLMGAFNLVVLTSHAANNSNEDKSAAEQEEPEFSVASYEPIYDDAAVNESRASDMLRSELEETDEQATDLTQEQPVDISTLESLDLKSRDLETLQESPSPLEMQMEEQERQEVEIQSRAESIDRNDYQLDSNEIGSMSARDIAVPEQVIEPEEKLADAVDAPRSTDINTTEAMSELRQDRSQLQSPDFQRVAPMTPPRLRKPSESSLASNNDINRETSQRDLVGALESQLLQQHATSPLVTRASQLGESLSPSDLVLGQVDLPAWNENEVDGEGQEQMPTTDVATLGLESRRSGDVSRAGAGQQSESANTNGTGSVAATMPRGLITGPLGPRDTGLRRTPRSLSDRVLGPATNNAASQVPQQVGIDRSDRIARANELAGRPPVAGPVAAPAFARRADRNNAGTEAADLGKWGPQTEAAIEAGLKFLADNQRAEGSWALEDYGDRPFFQSQTAATALALLAFQGAGYSHMQYQYQEQCAKAVNFLTAHQQADGDLYISMNTASDRNARFYSHGIAALALCEAYGMTQDERLRGPAQKSIDFLVATQDPVGGGWRYSPNSESDLSVTGWCMMAMKSAELAGLKVDTQAYRKVGTLLDEAKASDERPYLFRYNPRAADTPTTRHGLNPTITMTSVGLLLRMYSGWRRTNQEMVKGADTLLTELPQIGTTRDPRRDTYYWYYATQVIFHMGGEYWAAWNNTLHPMLIQTQVRSGRWQGSWDPRGPIPDRWGPFAGRLYVTTLNLLSLEVHYRHLPIYEDTGK